MEQELIITRVKDYIVSAINEGGRIEELSVEEKQGSMIGNIYIGKVKNIVSNIRAAFVEIEGGQLCYYSLAENKHPFFVTPKNSQKLVVGDEILVQVEKEAIKTKAPVVTSHLNITGKYVVLTTGKSYLGISNKITDQEERKRLREICSPFVTEEYGIVVRTNGQGATKMQLEREIKVLADRLQHIYEIAPYRNCFQLIYESDKGYLCYLRDQNASKMKHIYIDQEDLYEEVRQYLLTYQEEDIDKLVDYRNKPLSLNQCYGIEKVINGALRKRVWLDSGAYLVIEPTEAMVVIDVNTGKAIGKKNMKEHILNVNLEAAKEIVRQLRLRNLSGIIIVDFIDMKGEIDRETLMKEFAKYLKADRNKTDLIEMTKLNLVEITRKKGKRALHEIMIDNSVL